jgi:hypothetical protein
MVKCQGSLTIGGYIMKLTQSYAKTLALSSALSLFMFGATQSIQASTTVSDVIADDTETKVVPSTVTPVLTDPSVTDASSSSSSSIVTPSAPTRMIEVWDANGDGHLNFKEIPGFIKSKLDFDGDGKLTFNDVKVGVLHIFDRNNDGILNWDDAISFQGQVTQLTTKLTDLMAKVQASGILSALPTAQSTQLTDLFHKIQGGVVVAENGYGKLVDFGSDVKTKLQAVSSSIKAGNLDPVALGAFKSDISSVVALVNAWKDTGSTKSVATKLIDRLNGNK